MRELTGKKVYINDVPACYLIGNNFDTLKPFEMYIWPNCSIKVLPARSTINAFVKSSDYIFGALKFEKDDPAGLLPNVRVISLPSGAYFNLVYHKKHNLLFELDYPLSDIYILNRGQVGSDLVLVLQKAFKVKKFRDWDNSKYVKTWKERMLDIYTIVFEIQKLLLEEGEV